MTCHSKESSCRASDCDFRAEHEVWSTRTSGVKHLAHRAGTGFTESGRPQFPTLATGDSEKSGTPGGFELH